MVFEWVSQKFKERQLKKAQIQAEADHMVIVSGLSILNPTARTFFKDMPFYDMETDAVDFKKLEQYICDLKSWRYTHVNKECEECYYKSNYDQFFNAQFEFKFELNELRITGCNTSYSLGFVESQELENLRKLFLELTGRDDYYHPDIITLKKEVNEFKEGYRNLDETISNFENKIYEKNKEIERLQTKLDEKPIKTKEIVKVIEEKPMPQDNRPIKRSSSIYNKFKLHVLKRDMVCQCCGSTENLHVHHLSSFKLHNSRGADTDNGIALCEECHKQYHSIYGNLHKNNPVNFAKFLREYGTPLQSNLDYVIGESEIKILGGK